MHRRSCLGIALMLAGAGKALALPAKSVHLIVPYPAGGPADATARLVEPLLSAQLGQRVLVENFGGVGGALGIQRLLASSPDGHHLLLGTPSDVILAPLTRPEVKHRPEQLRLIGVVGRAPLLLVGGARQAAMPLNRLIEGRSRTGAAELSFGSTGVGSLFHLVAEDFVARAGLGLTHVPYQGAPPLIQDLIGGQVDFAFLPLAGTLLELVRPGRLRAYALANARRSAFLPALPTMTEATGWRDFDYDIWTGLFVHRSTPESAAERLHSIVAALQRDSTFVRQLAMTGTDSGPRLDMLEVERFMAAQIERHRRLVEAVKLGVL